MGTRRGDGTVTDDMQARRIARLEDRLAALEAAVQAMAISRAVFQSVTASAVKELVYHVHDEHGKCRPGTPPPDIQPSGDSAGEQPFRNKQPGLN
jgi:hypothetical protein